MVPVPEELAVEVRDYLDWKVSGRPEEQPAIEALDAVWEGAEPAVRSVIHYIATRCTEDVAPTFREVAAEMGVSVHEVAGLIADICARSRYAGGPLFPVATRDDIRERPADVPKWEHRVCAMTNQVAQRFLSM